VGAGLFEAHDLAGADLGIVDVEDVEMVLLVLAVAVDADDHRLGPIDRSGAGGGGLLDPALGHAFGHRLGHAAQAFDLLDQHPGFLGQLVGQRLDIIRAAERICDIGDAALLGNDELGVAGDAGREVGR